jgi:hypothetical protein
MKMNLPQSSEISETTYSGIYSYMPEATNLPNEGFLTHFAPTGKNERNYKNGKFFQSKSYDVDLVLFVPCMLNNQFAALNQQDARYSSLEIYNII